MRILGEDDGNKLFKLEDAIPDLLPKDEPIPSPTPTANPTPKQGRNESLKQDDTSQARDASGKININTASQEELQSLPGVGPKFAEKIIESRPYGSVEDLRYLPRIPHKTLDAIIPLCTVD